MKKLKSFVPIFRQVLNYMGHRHVATVAAGSAFWVFLSLVPMVILIAALLPYTGITQEALFTVLSAYTPPSLRLLLEDILRDVYAGGPALLSLSVLSMIWSAARGFSALIRGLEQIYEPGVYSSYFHRRFRAVLYLLALVAAMLLSVLFMGFGRTVQLFVEKHFPGTHGFFLFLPKLRYGVIQCMLVLIFASIYRWIPGHHRRFSKQFPGAVFSALGWSLFSSGFSFWISHTHSFSIYGSLATVAVVMIWLYYCMSILLWGACLNKALEKLEKLNEY